MWQENDSSWHRFESPVWRTVNFPRLLTSLAASFFPSSTGCPLSFIKTLTVGILLGVVLMVGRERREELSICGN